MTYLDTCDYPTGAHLIRQGERADDMFFIESGRMQNYYHFVTQLMNLPRLCEPWSIQIAGYQYLWRGLN